MHINLNLKWWKPGLLLNVEGPWHIFCVWLRTNFTVVEFFTDTAIPKNLMLNTRLEIWGQHNFLGCEFLHFIGNIMPKKIFFQQFTYHFSSFWYLPGALSCIDTHKTYQVSFINLHVLVELNTRSHDGTMHSGILEFSFFLMQIQACN